MVIFGVFVALGSVSASQAEVLQPAEEVVYNEELRVNGTGRFSSVYIGEQGVGGVTFFNGTIVNSTTDDGADNPVTFGDGVRIDGEIWRTEKGGDNPLKISDHVMPTLHNTNDMGIEGHAWRNMYYADTLHGGSADLSGDLEVDGDINAHGNIVQDRTDNGVVKALAYVDGSATGCSVPEQFSSTGSTITCTRFGQGVYIVNFGFKVDDRFIQMTGWGDATFNVAGIDFIGNNNQVNAVIYSVVTDSVRDGDFVVTVY